MKIKSEANKEDARSRLSRCNARKYGFNWHQMMVQDKKIPLKMSHISCDLFKGIVSSNRVLFKNKLFS
jgi:hypothetical protein